MSSFTPTTRTAEALQAALQDASKRGNPDIRPAHLLVALLEQADSIASPVIQAVGADPNQVLTRARSLVGGYPTATGQQMANPQFNRDSLNALTTAQELAGQLGDSYVSTEVLLAGIASGDSDAAKLLQEFGATADALKAAFPSVRGNQKVTTEDPEGQFQALEKYSTDLTA
ncbi:MAG: Clp protease N-terminal domain-containing protein, partial [Corynebacterium kroppenstedtii]|nr:Clp protease N-terminal domain-containing protein [Corynebacterium kroppenstedtii]